MVNCLKPGTLEVVVDTETATCPKLWGIHDAGSHNK
jgi:hypothetical protein